MNLVRTVHKSFISEFLEPKKEYAEELQKCETLLKNVIETSANEKASPLFEANLLLAKLHYYW